MFFLSRCADFWNGQKSSLRAVRDQRPSACHIRSLRGPKWPTCLSRLGVRGGPRSQIAARKYSRANSHFRTTCLGHPPRAHNAWCRPSSVQSAHKVLARSQPDAPHRVIVKWGRAGGMCALLNAFGKMYLKKESTPWPFLGCPF